MCCITDSLCCVRETNSIVNQLYSNKKFLNDKNCIEHQNKCLKINSMAVHRKTVEWVCLAIT